MVRERRPITFGVPFSARSMGTVTWRSTSSAANPGYGVMTTTPGSEISGYASSFSFAKAQVPVATRTRAPRIVIRRWASARSSSRASRLSVLQQDGAVHHDALARRQAGEDRDALAFPCAHYDFAALEPRRLALHEDDGAPVLLDHRRQRHHRGPAARGDVAERSEHVRAEPAGIGQLDVDLHRSGLGIEDVGDPGDAAGEDFARERDQPDLDRVLHTHQGDRGLGDVRAQT